jgi:hypothetical protein
VGLAARGLRDLDSGAVAIEDEAERATLRAQAARVRLRSAAAAVALTALGLLLP